MVRIIISLFFFMVWAIPFASAETTPEEILNAIDQMTPEQAHEVQTRLEKRKWDPIPGGFFDRLAVKGSGIIMHTGGVDLDSLSLSSGNEIDLDDVNGNELSLQWRLFNERFRAGFKLSSLDAEDADLGAAGYTRAELQMNTAAIVANYQLVRTDAFLWWTEAAGGGGCATLDLLDTPAGGTSTIRHYDNEFGMGELSTGMDWRFNAKLTLSAFAGYQFAEKVRFEEADQKTDVTMEPEGFKGGIGLTYNF